MLARQLAADLSGCIVESELVVACCLYFLRLDPRHIPVAGQRAGVTERRRLVGPVMQHSGHEHLVGVTVQEVQ